ncbi:FAD-binding oxidoreductase [Oceanicola sp. S124]|uniref:FAD-binding oxidoreductase n=1 Tax=Oceanicola sp. S124 TaxID=1042378 RepID=UPI0002559393|nr:FAD-binding oxidoreductase [Oceanicola sp. S124]
MSDDPLLVALAGHDLAPLSDPDACARFATDATRRVESVPTLVLRPAGTAGVSAVLAACHAAGRPVVVQGGLTGLSGGARVRPGEVVLSLERMRSLGPVDPLSAQIEVEAGATLQAVQSAAAAHDLVFGVDLGARGTATIGGMVATNAGGIRVLRYGMMRAQVAGLEVVLADGSVIRAMRGLDKDNAGPALHQLFIGSEGTYGVITRALLRLHPAPTLQANALIAVDDVPQAQALLRHLQARLGGLLSAYEGIWPEVYEGATARLGTMPLPCGAGLYVLAEIQGMQQILREEAFEAALIEAYEAGLCRDIVVAQSGREHDQLWALREACVEYTFGLGELVPHDLSLPAHALPAFLDKARALLARIDPEARPYIYGHLGDGNLHYIVQTVRRSEVSTALNALAAGMGGSVTAEHGLGQDKAPYLAMVRSGAEIDLMGTLKRALDPQGLLGRGRVLPG